MKFLIKNYNKDEDNDREILATVLFEVKTIKEAQEKMAEFIKEIKNNWQTNLKNGKTIGETAAMIVNLYHIIDGLDIENYKNGNHEEFISKFDSHTRNVVNPTEKPVVAFLNDLMRKQESEADCMATIDWCFDLTDESSPKIILEKGKCDISGMYFQDQEEDWDEETFGTKMPFEKATYNIWEIPLTRFEECVKKIPDSWLDDSIGIVFSARNY
jgi:hypothetical protein